MMRNRNLLSVLAMSLMFAATATNAAEMFESQIVADFEFMLPSDGALAGAGFPEDVFIPFQAKGTFVFELDDAVNDPAATSAAFINATGTLIGVSPAPFLPFDIRPIEFVSGSLTNIVRDGGGAVISADVDALSMKWEINAAPGGNAIRIYSRVVLPFDADVDSVPFSVGTVLTGPAEFEGFLDIGMGANDPLAIIGRNRTLTVVPEPTSLALLGMALGWIACCGRRRRRRR